MLPVVGADTHADPRFLTNPLVTGDPSLHSYVGVPLCSPGAASPILRHVFMLADGTVLPVTASFGVARLDDVIGGAAAWIAAADGRSMSPSARGGTGAAALNAAMNARICWPRFDS
ncbi:MAG TPA: hypothetical protein VFQ57_06440 [Sphingomonas sp.]|jgi:hypothetical protein|nr:hypothetical protein [Sphingomonas sp.]